MLGKTAEADCGKQPASKSVKQGYIKNTRKPSVKQSVVPGTALTAYLKRYRFDLLALSPDRHVSQLMDCVDCLLFEAEQVRAA